jgi:hypothetical protein
MSDGQAGNAEICRNFGSGPVSVGQHWLSGQAGLEKLTKLSSKIENILPLFRHF